MSLKQILFVLLMLSATSQAVTQLSPISVGSKTFTESYVLAEIMAQLLEANGHEVSRRFGFGGTLIAFQALRNGDIDVYPEYTGTISEVILVVLAPSPRVFQVFLYSLIPVNGGIIRCLGRRSRSGAGSSVDCQWGWAYQRL